ncbi:MAG: hypothetical protein JRI68_04580, partial [Deltaproteobacteria bacterium]|nr:hypothetical protein [Deltaproteobacteria bacterium]
MRTGRLATILALTLGSLAGGALPAHAEQPLRWTTTTGAGRSSPPVGSADQQLYGLCGTRDLGLVQVAKAVVARRVG